MTIKPGALRFNTDSMKLEIFRGSAEYGGFASMAGIGTLAAGQWEEIQATSPEVQTGGTRGFMIGGYNPSNTYLDDIKYINVSTTGNSQQFGELSVSDRNHVNAAVSDRTRAISAGGSRFPGIMVGDMEFITMASEGDSVDFNGDLVTARYGSGSGANSTRGIFGAGLTTPGAVTDLIDYVNIQSKGTNAQDFGNCSHGSKQYHAASMSSPTRTVFAGGRVNPAYYNVMEYVTTSTLGNTSDFGDMVSPRGFGTTGSITSNATRGIILGGYKVPAYYDYIDYITIPTLGNALDFGNLLSARGAAAGATSSTRAVMMGGAAPGYTTVIQYVQIMSTGDSLDFGDLDTQTTAWGAGASNGHGGL